MIPTLEKNHPQTVGADSMRLLAELHHSRAARIRVAGGGAGGDAPDAQASTLGFPHGQPQPPKRLSPSWDTTNHGGVQRGVSHFPSWLMSASGWAGLLEAVVGGDHGWARSSSSHFDGGALAPCSIAVLSCRHRVFHSSAARPWTAPPWSNSVPV